MRFSLILLLSLFSLNISAQDRYKELLERVQELEKNQELILLESSEKFPEVNSFFKDNLKLGGFFEPSYTFISGPDTKSQAGSNSHVLGFNVAADYSSRVRFASQFITALTVPLTNEHNDPNAPSVSTGSKSREYKSYFFGSLVAQGYVEYKFSSSLRIQSGLGYVPFGYYPQLREPVLFVRRGGPQTQRTTNLFMPLWMGVNIVGNLHEYNSGYNIYTAPSVEESQKPGIGARVWKNSMNDRYNFGLSTQIGKNTYDTYQVLGADLKMNFEKFTITSEYVTQLTDGENPWSMYVEPSFFIYQQEVLLYVFGDYASASRNKTGTGTTAILDPYRKWEYGGGLNWLPTSYTRYRMAFTYHDYVGSRAVVLGQNRDYLSLDLSVGVTF